MEDLRGERGGRWTVADVDEEVARMSGASAELVRGRKGEKMPSEEEAGSDS